MKPTLFAISLVLLARAVTAGDEKAAPLEAKATSADGLSIAYDVRGKGEKTLVFIHGWCCGRYLWKGTLDVFAKDYRVVSLDLPGHGASGRDRAEWSLDAFAGDVEAVVKALDAKDVILVGHSMGGPIALLAAKRMPDRVVGIVGVDTLHNVEFKWPEEQGKQVVAMFEADFEGTVRGSLKGMLPATVDPALVKSIEDVALAADRKMAVAMMRSFGAFDAVTALKEAKVPVRCINAAPGTTAFGQPTSIDANRKYGDFDAVLMEGVGHFPMLEKPEEFNGKLGEVLKDLPAGPAKQEGTPPPGH